VGRGIADIDYIIRNYRTAVHAIYCPIFLFMNLGSQMAARIQSRERIQSNQRLSDA
jgi:hypothetical protein